MFSIPAVVAGYNHGTVGGVVHAKVADNKALSTLKENQYLQEVSEIRKCTPLNFSVLAPKGVSRAEIQLTVDIRDPLDSAEVATHKRGIKFQTVLNVPLAPCPIGFSLPSTPPYACKCHPTLEENGVIHCIISEHRGWVYRRGRTWLSSTFYSNETDKFIVHQFCPLDYCDPKNVSIELDDPDKQCVEGRTGILCGECQRNLSLSLGSTKCTPCNNRYLLLLIVFAIAGVALVLFLKIFDLTVAQGAVNGLIFYANIAWAYNSIIFQYNIMGYPHKVLKILHIFIAWINLDLGMTICFAQGLNAYWKTWLQFVFPIYIWTIAGAIIIAARYSTRASKMSGNNSVPVLATIILLSYTKLLRTIISAFKFSLLEYPQGTQIVWSLDGNVPYFGGAHVVLMVAAFSVLILLWLPFTTVLLCGPCLRRKSHKKPLRWINRLKPFFDAYYGQLKPNYHYWTGLFLLIRVFLLVLFATTAAIYPMANVLAVTFVVILTLAFTSLKGQAYKKLYFSFLENAFLVNLSLLSAGTLYTQAAGTPNTVVLYISLTSAFIKFSAIVVYHGWIRAKSVYTTYKRRQVTTEQNTSNTDFRGTTGSEHQMQYREPLLESTT